MPQAIRDVGVLGLGVMGFDIAFLYALNGYPTRIFDASKAAMDAVGRRRDDTIARLKRRDRLTARQEENVRACLLPAPSIDSMAGLQLVTEAVSEAAKTKLAVYDALANSGFNGILTTNTSSLTRRSLLGASRFPAARFVTTHFFNPVLYTRMVEVVAGDMAAENLDATLSFLKDLGRQPVETRDISGFVSNSVLMYYAVMAMHLLEHGARIEDIDDSAKSLGLLPPLVSFDSWNPSIVEDVTRVMGEFRRDAFLRSSRLLAEFAKDNPRFYIDQKPNAEIYSKIPRGAASPERSVIESALQTVVHVAAAAAAELGENPERIDYISLEGLRFRDAPLKQIDAVGAAAVLNRIAELTRRLPGVPLAAPGLLEKMAAEQQTFFLDGTPNPWVEAHAARN